jgi:hypothetical protein
MLRLDEAINDWTTILFSNTVTTCTVATVTPTKSSFPMASLPTILKLGLSVKNYSNLPTNGLIIKSTFMNQ